jgi:phosphonate C-P lyase system protein PhnH
MFAFFCQGKSGGLITQLSKGTLLEPESGTTVFYCVGRLIEGNDWLEENLDWVTLELTGPGIEYMHKVSVIGLARSEITLINLTRQGYPLGIDVYLIDYLGRCVALPRTTRIRMVG